MTASTLVIVADNLGGGLGAAVVAQAEWFAAHGWRVCVAAPDEAHIPNVRTAVVPIPPTIRRAGAALRAARRLRAVVRSEHPDVVHVHGLRSTAVALAAGVRHPFVTGHGIAAQPSDPPLHHLARRVGRAAVPFVGHASTAEPGYGHRWRYVPMASPHLGSLSDIPFPAAHTTPTFVWIGLLDERKRPEVFVRAIADVAASGQPVRGVIAGDGPRVEEIARLVHVTGAPIELVGHVEPGQVLPDAWACALFSRSEGTPLAVEEAMWAGRSVIANRLPGVEYLVGTSGTLIDRDDEAAVAVRTLCDHTTARHAGAAAAERIRALLAVDDPWPLFASLYAASRR